MSRKKDKSLDKNDSGWALALASARKQIAEAQLKIRDLRKSEAILVRNCEMASRGRNQRHKA